MTVLYRDGCGMTSPVSRPGGTVTTEMSCEHENDTLLPATLKIAAAPEGDVVWKAGEKVVLEESAFDEGDGLILKVIGIDNVTVVAVHEAFSGKTERLADRRARRRAPLPAPSRPD